MTWHEWLAWIIVAVGCATWGVRALIDWFDGSMD